MGKGRFLLLKIASSVCRRISPLFKVSVKFSMISIVEVRRGWFSRGSVFEGDEFISGDSFYGDGACIRG